MKSHFDTTLKKHQNLLLVSLIAIIGSSLYFYDDQDKINSYAQYSLSVDTIKSEDSFGVTTVDTVSNKVYVTNHRAGTVTVFDGVTNEEISKIKVGEKPYGIGINSQTKLLYVALEENNQVVVVDTTTNEIIETLEMSRPYDIAINHNTNQVYVTSDIADEVFLIDGSTNQIMNSWSVEKPCGIAVNTETNRVYVTSEVDNNLYVLDDSLSKEISKIKVGTSPRGVTVNPVTNMVYVTNQQSNSVSVIDGATNEIVNTFEVGQAPRRIVVNENTNTLYVSNQFSHSISVIDGDTNKILDSTSVNQPYELAINTNLDKVYVTYFPTNTFTIISDDSSIGTDYSQALIGLIIIIIGGTITILILKFKKKSLVNS